MLKRIWKHVPSRIWLVVTALLLVVCTLATSLTLGVKQLYELLNTVMPGGGPRAVFAEGKEGFYFSDYAGKAEVYEAARALNQELCEEGMVLLKNNNGALPMAAPARVSVFGKNSVNLAYGGSGSGGANTSNVVDLYTALAEAGFECNPTLKAFYDSEEQSGPQRKGNSKNLDSGDTVILSTAETPQSMYTDAVTASYQDYKDEIGRASCRERV